MTRKTWSAKSPRIPEPEETRRRGFRGMNQHPLYTRWARMMERCYNPAHNRYKYYGARGIKVIRRWHSFWTFVDDMFPSLPRENSKARKDRYTLSRRNHSKDYSPSNVTWELPAVHYGKKAVVLEAAE